MTPSIEAVVLQYVLREVVELGSWYLVPHGYRDCILAHSFLKTINRGW